MSDRIQHFPLISEPEDDERTAPGEPGEIVLRNEAARKGKGEPKIGIVHLLLARPRRELQKENPTIVCSVVFDFGGGDTLSASGALPADEEHVIGAGNLAITGGTGVYRGQAGDLVVTIENPKGWRIVSL